MNQTRIMHTGHEREVGGGLPKERERHRVQAFPGKCFSGAPLSLGPKSRRQRGSRFPRVRPLARLPQSQPGRGT